MIVGLATDEELPLGALVEDIDSLVDDIDVEMLLLPLPVPDAFGDAVGDAVDDGSDDGLADAVDDAKLELDTVFVGSMPTQ